MKSIKLKNDNYLDSSGVVHNRTALNTYLDGIIESGSGYIKYNDGTMICWDKKTETKTGTLASGLYYSVFGFTYPKSFIDIPIVIPSVVQPSGVYFASLGNSGAITKSTCQVRALCINQYSNVSLTASYMAIGKWK